MSTVYDFTPLSLEGEPCPLRRFEGQVLLIVNVASRCGFTPQYTELEELYRAWSPRGFSVLGFPCDQFAHQEPGSAEEIRTFCSTSYDVTFPLFAKIRVNGPDTDPLYRHLKSQAKGVLGTELIKWNFTKFLVSRAGEVVSRHAPRQTPGALRSTIEALL